MRRSQFFTLTALALIMTGLSSDGRAIRIVPSDAPTYAAMGGDPVDLGTGLYVRTHVDLALIDSLPVVFARVYRNRDSISRPFGIGTNHSLGSFLVGDAPALSYIDLILADGGRIHYQRTSGGFGAAGAEYVHTTTPSEYLDSRLFWNGRGWTIQMRNGSVYTYPACPPSLNKPCTVSSYRDRNGNEIHMRHDARMNLVRVETQHGAAIDLTYDDHDRIILARSSYGQRVSYEYDPGGRLTRVVAADGSDIRYAYDTRHQMVKIDEPGLSIRNTYDDAGRCILNDVTTERRRDGVLTHDHLVYTFAYTIGSGDRIIATDVDGPDGHRHVTYNERGYRLTDTTQARSTERGTRFDRDAVSNFVRRLSVWCGPDGRQVKVEADINPDASPEVIQRNLQETCRRVAKQP